MNWLRTLWRRLVGQPDHRARDGGPQTHPPKTLDRLDDDTTNAGLRHFPRN